MQLNRRHKVGLFLTIVIVGAGLLLDVSAKQAVGLALLSLATTWLVGNINLKNKNESFQVGAPKIVENLATHQSSEKALPDESSQNPETNKLSVRARHGGSWFWMIASTLIFVILLGLGIFNMSWQLMVGEAEKAGESLGKTLIPVLLLGFGARQAWSSLLAKEPETDPAYRRRHRRFNVIAGTCSMALLLGAMGFGVVTGNRIQKNKRLDSVVSEIAKLGPKNSELRGQIKEIVSEEAPTFHDYYLRSLKLESVLNEYDVQQQRVRPLLDDLLSETADQPKLAETIRTIQRINEKDVEVVSLFRLEIAKTKQLISLPTSQQASFYRQEIVPIEQKVSNTAQEEIQMMRDAENAGMKLPSDLREFTNPNR